MRKRVEKRPVPLTHKTWLPGTLLTASTAPLGGSLWAQEAQEKNPYS